MQEERRIFMQTSAQIKQRFEESIPWGSSTCAKVPRQEFEPCAMKSGKGCRTYDVLGNDYVDFKCALGPVTLGYSYEPCNEAIRRQLEDGIAFSNPHILECEVAEKLVAHIGCFEKVRFLRTGGEACAAVIRIARAYTGKNHIIQIGYNGWLNGLAIGGKVLPNVKIQQAVPGVPLEISAFYHAANWNDMQVIEDYFEQYKDDVAAVIVSADYEHMAEGKTFYPALRKITEENGALLMYDEIVTGFRIALGGVGEYFGVQPDLAVFSKGMGNGVAISAYGGKKEIMETCGRNGKAFITSTSGGETIGLASVNVVIDTYLKEDVIGHMWKMGKKMWDGVNALFDKYHIPLEFRGLYPCPALCEADESTDKGRFMNLAFKHGVVLYGTSYVNFSHQDSDITEAHKRLEEACKEYIQE